MLIFFAIETKILTTMKKKKNNLSRVTQPASHKLATTKPNAQCWKTSTALARHKPSSLKISGRDS